MRNWNPRIGRSCSSGRVSFSAYLWGIETNYSQTPQYLLSVCFQRTYEELKQFRVALPESQEIISFQRTYEELKQALTTIFQSTSLSFQRTYEELKPRRRNCLRAQADVFSVPMRNWNPNAPGSLPPWPAFSAYLRGIETSSFKIG